MLNNRKTMASRFGDLVSPCTRQQEFGISRCKPFLKSNLLADKWEKHELLLSGEQAYTKLQSMIHRHTILTQHDRGMHVQGSYCPVSSLCSVVLLTEFCEVVKDTGMVRPPWAKAIGRVTAPCDPAVLVPGKVGLMTWIICSAPTLLLPVSITTTWCCCCCCCCRPLRGDVADEDFLVVLSDAMQPLWALTTGGPRLQVEHLKPQKRNS